MKSKSNKSILTVFSLTMITVGSVDSIRNLPTTALFGSQLISFFILGAIFFLIPSALISAELASRFPDESGIYVWAREAFGKKIGFLAVWLQWIENVIWYPALLAFVAGTIGFLFSPELAKNKYFLFAVILISFWGTTLINLSGMRTSAFFSTLCTIFGLLVPMTLIITLGVIWFTTGNPLQIHFSLSDMLPAFNDANVWVSLTAIMMSFCGIEIATVHARDVDNPQRAFPLALTYSVLIILVTLMLGSLAIAIVLPHGEISLVAGIMQAFQSFFFAYHLHWLMPVVALMLVVGGLGSVNNWIIAPTRGLLIAGGEGNLPPSLQVTNPHGAPTKLLFYQAIIVSILSAVFLFMPSVNSAYWFLTALAAELYMLMYLIMFLAAIVLRVKKPAEHLGYRVAGGAKGLCFVAALGILGTLTTIIISFLPPSEVDVGRVLNYELCLVGGMLLMCLPPLLTAKYGQSHWASQKA